MHHNLACLSSADTTTAQSTSALIETQQYGPDTDISSTLAEKRKQIDDEIAKFKSLKEKEFRDFERDLLKQRQRQRQTLSTAPAQTNRLPGDSGSPLSLLKEVVHQTCHQPNEFVSSERENTKAGVITPPVQRKPSPVTSKPTLCVDKLNINGESNVPPVTVTATVADGSSGMPSHSLAPKRHFSHSTSNPAEALACLALPLHQQSHQEKELETKEEFKKHTVTMVSSHDTHSNDKKNGQKHNTNNLANVLAPTYLPLLETYTGTQVRALSSTSGSMANSASASISPVSQHRRIKTEPILPSNSLPLPSALRRTPSGSAIRKHKHVTLRLADSVIVEPSSSYEEGPSPVAEEELQLSGIGHTLGMHEHEIRQVELGEKKSAEAEREEDFGSSVSGLLERRRIKPRKSDGKESEEKRKRKKKQQQQQHQPPEQAQEQRLGHLSHSLRSPFEVSVNGNFGSGVGFFELDEELIRPARDLRFLDDDDDGDNEAGSRRFRHHGLDEDDEEEHNNNVSSLDATGVDLEEQFSEKGIKSDTYVYSASVPIDIVKPSGSWTERFAH